MFAGMAQESAPGSDQFLAGVVASLRLSGRIGKSSQLGRVQIAAWVGRELPYLLDESPQRARLKWRTDVKRACRGKQESGRGGMRWACLDHSGE